MRRLIVWVTAVAASVSALVMAGPATGSSDPAPGCAPRGYGEVDQVEYGALDPFVNEGQSTLEPPVNDPLFRHQWNLRTLNVPAAWMAGATGEGQRIAIVDTGVDLNHPDLQPQLVRGHSVLKKDEDPEWNQVHSCLTMDVSGHGTTVAGLAAAATDNGIGMAGVAPDAVIVPVQFTGTVPPDGELNENFTNKVAEALRWAADNADVINFSAGQYTDKNIRAAIERAVKKGVTVVAVAGNRPGVCQIPGAMRGVICVSGVDRRGNPVPHHGSPVQLDPYGRTVNEGVAVRAPSSWLDGPSGYRTCESQVAGQARPVLARGEQLWTTTKPGTRPDEGSCSQWRGYNLGGQTSQAAPQVAGVAALLRSKGLKAGEVLDCLRLTSSNNGQWDPVMGYGVPDAGRAVTECPSKFKKNKR